MSEAEFRRLLQSVGNELNDAQTGEIAVVYGISPCEYGNGAEMLSVLYEKKEVRPDSIEKFREALERNHAGADALDFVDNYKATHPTPTISSGSNFGRGELQTPSATIVPHSDAELSSGATESGDDRERLQRSILSNNPPTLHTFTEREDIGNALFKHFKSPRKNGATRYFALVAEGGAGKTQMSLWFCEQMKERILYDVIWLMSGDGLERFTEDLEDLMDELEIEYHGIHPKKLKRTLTTRLNERGNWLLVVDNFDGMYSREIEERIPERGGTVLLTSRDHRVLPAKNIVRVKPFSDEEAMRLFENILGEGKVEESLIHEVGELLGHNAFALSVCAYYLYESSIQADELAKEEIVKRMHELVTEMKHAERGETVEVMYERSLLKLETESPAAWKLLCKLSLVSPDGVDEDIVEGFELDHTTCMGKIQRLGLAEKRGDKYHVHRLMMKVVQERMKKSTKEFTSVLEEVIEDMDRMWIEGDSDHTLWKKIQEMGEHVVSLSIHEEHLSSTKSREDLVWRLYSFSHYTIEVKGDYTTAEERITKAEQVEGGGKCSKGVRAALKSVRGRLRASQGKYTEAITEYREALEMEEEESRKAVYYNNIGICLEKLKKYPEALEEYEKSLEIKVKYKGEDSIEVSYTLGNMGSCLSRMGSYEEALEKHRRALKICLDKYGEVNPLVAKSYNNIGTCYTRMKKYEDALEMDEKALEIRRQVYGEECHPDVAMNLYNIGIVKRRLSRVEEAKPHLEEAYRIRKQMLGEDHPDTIKTKKILDAYDGFNVEIQSFPPTAA